MVYAINSRRQLLMRVDNRKGERNGKGIVFAENKNGPLNDRISDKHLWHHQILP